MHQAESGHCSDKEEAASVFAFILRDRNSFCISSISCLRSKIVAFIPAISLSFIFCEHRRQKNGAGEDVMR